MKPIDAKGVAGEVAAINNRSAVAKTISLREFQQGLARGAEAQTEAEPTSRWVAGGQPQRLLKAGRCRGDAAAADSGVPLTQPWYLGLATSAGARERRGFRRLHGQASKRAHARLRLLLIAERFHR